MGKKVVRKDCRTKIVGFKSFGEKFRPIRDREEVRKLCERRGKESGKRGNKKKEVKGAEKRREGGGGRGGREEGDIFTNKSLCQSVSYSILLQTFSYSFVFLFVICLPYLSV